MSNVKLSYFDFPGGRGEDCRLALHIAGMEFEDDRVDPANWPDLKPNMPYRAMPVLEIKGKPLIAQSNAILGLIGRKHDLLPEDDFEAARHIAILNAVEDIRAKGMPSFDMKDNEQKKAAREELASGYMKDWALNMEEQINGPFVGGNAISVADLKIFVFMNFIKGGKFDFVSPDYFGPYAKLEKMHESVANHPKVAEWRARFD